MGVWEVAILEFMACLRALKNVLAHPPWGSNTTLAHYKLRKTTSDAHALLVLAHKEKYPGAEEAG
jgi:hypothetical protein